MVSGKGFHCEKLLQLRAIVLFLYRLSKEAFSCLFISCIHHLYSVPVSVLQIIISVSVFFTFCHNFCFCSSKIWNTSPYLNFCHVVCNPNQAKNIKQIDDYYRTILCFLYPLNISNFHQANLTPIVL